MKQITQNVFKELMVLGLLKSDENFKNYVVVNKHKKSKQKTYYVEHRDLTEKEYADLKKYGRKSGNILDEYYETIG